MTQEVPGELLTRRDDRLFPANVMRDFYATRVYEHLSAAEPWESDRFRDAGIQRAFALS